MGTAELEMNKPGIIVLGYTHNDSFGYTGIFLDNDITETNINASSRTDP